MKTHSSLQCFNVAVAKGTFKGNLSLASPSDSICYYFCYICNCCCNPPVVQTKIISFLFIMKGTCGVLHLPYLSREIFSGLELILSSSSQTPDQCSVWEKCKPPQIVSINVTGITTVRKLCQHRYRWEELLGSETHNSHRTI